MHAWTILCVFLWMGGEKGNLGKKVRKKLQNAEKLI